MQKNTITKKAAAKMIGITPSTLLDWEKLFGWDVPRDHRGWRSYTEENIEQGKMVKTKLGLGMTMAEIMGHTAPKPDPEPTPAPAPWERQLAHAWGPEY